MRCRSESLRECTVLGLPVRETADRSARTVTGKAVACAQQQWQPNALECQHGAPLSESHDDAPLSVRVLTLAIVLAALRPSVMHPVARAALTNITATNTQTIRARWRRRRASSGFPVVYMPSG